MPHKAPDIFHRAANSVADPLHYWPAHQRRYKHQNVFDRTSPSIATTLHY